MSQLLVLLFVLQWVELPLAWHWPFNDAHRTHIRIKKVKAELELDDSDESMREKRSGESVGKKQMVQVKFSYRVQKGASLSDYVKACMNGFVQAYEISLLQHYTQGLRLCHEDAMEEHKALPRYGRVQLTLVEILELLRS